MWNITKQINISTHILTKRMTIIRSEDCRKTIFQLTSSRRGWLNSHPHEEDDEVFQLTSSRRGWPEEFNEKYDNIIFQLTSSRRGWQECFLVFVSKREFQLTSSRRGWRNIRVGERKALYFNSHPHEEDDQQNRNWNAV